MTDRDPSPRPSIADAKALCAKYRQRGVIVLGFGSRDVMAASYGMTKADCRAMARTLEQICDLLEDGQIAVPTGSAGFKTLYTAAEPTPDEEMLAACKAVLRIMTSHIHPDQFDSHVVHAMALVRNAIAKAEGRE